ncbi:armadillo-type protein [Collybia nuda]|uniref:Armadillo-type protein n=1 Tax=Collybia nuda TaxID=64659 RepID=A0A9P5Y408_9AGAR|nr:armadillo-type protein [Collybia nuda]
MFSAAVSPLLVSVINNAIVAPGGAEEEFQESVSNSAWVLGISLEALAKREITEWGNLFDLASWMRACLGRWAWSANVLAGLYAILKANPSKTAEIPLDEIYPFLQRPLLSHSRPLRLNALRLLESTLVDSPTGSHEVLKRCLQGEEVSLDVQGVRERVLRIGRVGQVLRDGDETGADICARWLIAQLKVNLRPLWSPAAGALSSLSMRFGDVVWGLLFRELQSLEGGQEWDRTPPWMENGQDIEEDANDPWEEERSWRDPTAHKFRSVIIKWVDDEYAKTELVKALSSKERFDLHSYEYQLLSTFGECSPLVEKHNRELVPHFLFLAGPDSSSRMPKQKLSAWLALFAKFNNPRALYSTDSLRALYISLLSHPDRALQTISLSCLFTYKSPHFTLHEDKLRALLDDARWRDELTSLDFEMFEPQDREEVVDVIIRLLFGIMLEKRGRTRGADRRAAILGTLAGCTDKELGLLVDLMLRPLNSSSTSRQDQTFIVCAVESSVSDKQQTGFLTLLGDVLKNLGPRLVRYWPSLLGTTIDLISNAQKRVDNLGHTEEVVEDDEGDEVEEVEEPTSSSKVVRSIRQLGLKRYADFFRCPISFDYTPYMSSSFTSFICPRLSSLDKENTQAPSALLELFYAWSAEDVYAKFLVDHDPQVLPKIYDCLVATNVKPSVISRIFDIVDRLLAHSTINEDVRETVIKPHVSLLLSNLSILVERTKGVSAVATPLGQRQITILSEIAQYSTDAMQASTLLRLFAPLLKRPAKLVPEKVKVDLLKIIGNLLPLIPDLTDSRSAVYLTTYTLLSQLFQSLRSRPARLGLISVFQRLATIQTPLQELVSLLGSLNAYSAKRMDEPDFDTRLSAFAVLNETSFKTLSVSDWLPLLYNSLHFIQDPAELAVRNNASYSMKHFIDVVAAQPESEYESMFLRVLLPGIKNGLRSKNEMVRAEVLGVIAYAVGKCDHIGSLKEMKILLADGDEEANFFNNVLHIQIHRRSRALRRLADHCDEGHLRSNTLADIFIPLIGNYIVSSSSIDHHLVNDAILATGRMAKHLAWGAYYSLVQRYLKLSRAKDESERIYVRTLVALLDNFHFPMEEIVSEVDDTGGDKEDVDAEDDGDPGVTENLEPPTSVPTSGPQPANQTSKIADAVNLRLLPNLLNHLEKHDATTDDNTRIPISIGIVTVAKHLPAATREAQITRLLTILSQILRSKSQETRDLTRDALSRIAVSLGPTYLPVILRELRGALLRGPQLHVLAYVAHALLVHVTTGDHANAFEVLDDCVNDISHVSSEVIFGESGKDVQSEEFKTKMREVRSSSSKGLDSFAIMAKYITPPKISSLLVPLRSIMHETESIKVMNLVEEVLKRISGGLNSNKHLVPAELLVLCNTLISQNARFLKQAPARRKPNAKGDAIVQVKRQVSADTDHYANNSFRFVSFGLDLFNTALRRNRFDFHDFSVMARLNSMVAVVGNTLYSTSAPVLLLGLKCAAGIAKCPVKSLDKSLPVFVRQIIDTIKQAGNTESEVVQTAFKSLANILRDGPAIQVKEKDLVYLLELLSPDIEEPSRQASVFTMLRAIVARKFVVPEIYDIMDKVSEVMVTSQSPQVQELCRGVLLQFLLDYPQGKGRLRNQMAFLAKNLSYVHESGRKSVMELLSAIVLKFEVNLVREYADLLFVALVMVVANDDSAKCREMASLLIKNLFGRLDDERRRVILSHLHSWASQHSRPQLARVSSQVYGFVIDVLQADSLPYISAILEDLKAALEHSTQSLEMVEKGNSDEVSMEVDLEWQVPYYAITVLSKILHIFPDFANHGERVAWNLVVSHLLFPHAWVRTASSKLLGLLFTAVPVAAPALDLPDDNPLSKIGMQDVTKKLCLQLKSEHLDDALGLQVVKNLFYVGKCFDTISVPDDSTEDKTDENFDDDTNENVEKDPKQHNLLPWLFSKLSYQIKSAHISRRNRTFSTPNWSQQPLSALRWFAAMTSYMAPKKIEKFLVHILTPVYRLIEDDTIRDSQMEELKTLATELQDLVQNKVGTTKFSAAYNQIRQGVLGVRRERKAAKVLQVTTNPEAAAKRKLQRNVIKKDSRKRKDRGYADGKGKIKRRREE